MHDVTRMTEKAREGLRKKCLRDLFSFCVAVMGYGEIEEEPHGSYCDFLAGPGNRKQATMPRSFVKTWIGSIAYPIWATLPRKQEDEFSYYKAWEDKFWQLGPNMRILIASYVVSNAEKMIGLIRKTYEANQCMQILFPEVIPHNFNRVKWSNQSACVNRNEQFTESTFEAAGIGGASTSRHYDTILEDDLIYSKKDDFSGRELQPNQEEIDKAIGWHKIATSLLVPGKHTRIHNTGTRWAKNDLVAYLWKNHPEYATFIRGAVDMRQLKSRGDWEKCDPTWVECFDHEQLKVIRNEQGPYMFATQYLLHPSSPEERLFKPEWLQQYHSDTELPKATRIFTTVDLAEWSEPTRKSDCDAVILTCAWCDKNHMWLMHYDKGRFDPSQVIEIMARHWKMFKPERIGIESVYYQKALAHFARKEMESGKIPYMSITQLKPEGNVAKEVRIRALEPLASNLAIHCKVGHKDWIEEFADYVPNSKLCKKDLLDAAAYQLQIARPGDPIPLEGEPRTAFVFVSKVGTTDEEKNAGKQSDWYDKLISKDGNKDVFGNAKVTRDPYSGEEDMVHAVTDPFYPSEEEEGVEGL